MTNIFISYRRKDSAFVSGLIYERLAEHFGPDSIFKDIDSIPLGINFKGIIDKKVGKCDIFLVIIGEKWLSVTDDNGRPRLQNPDDYVRLEIESALKREIPVIPLLVGDITIPSANELPESLKELANRNGTPIRPKPTLDSDIDRLIRGIDKLGRLSPVLTGEHTKPATGIVVNTLPKTWIIAAVLLVTIAGAAMLVPTENIENLLEALKPVNKEKLTNEKAEVARSLSEIKSYKQQIETARNDLSSKIKNAENSKSKQLESLKYWQQMSEKHLFSGNKITELEGMLAASEALISEKAYALALQSTTAVRDGYKKLWDDFNTIEKLSHIRVAANKAKAEWIALKASYNVSAQELEQGALRAVTEASVAERSFSYTRAVEQYEQALKRYEEARRATARRVAQIENERTIYRAQEARKRKAEEEQKRKADEERNRKAEEERKMKAEEERKRKAEEERKRKEEELRYRNELEEIRIRREEWLKKCEKWKKTYRRSVEEGVKRTGKHVIKYIKIDTGVIGISIN